MYEYVYGQEKRRGRCPPVLVHLLNQFDRAGIGHQVFAEEARALLVRSADGILRRARNLAISALVEAVRDQSRGVDLKHVNAVLVQPHWRKDYDVNPL